MNKLKIDLKAKNEALLHLNMSTLKKFRLLFNSLREIEMIVDVVERESYQHKLKGEEDLIRLDSKQSSSFKRSKDSKKGRADVFN